MCGISAVISRDGRANRQELHSLTKLVDHRGPDGMGMWTNEDENGRISVGLGHTRLSILDLTSSSDQPFLSRDGHFAITFNGEIYNFLELRSELKLLGHQFDSTGDTEVLMAALIEWGIDALPKLRGMFAFVFLDIPNMRVLVARDEFGIKPLYRCEHNGKVFFASEIKQFSAIENRRNRLNPEASVEFLLYGVTDHRKSTHFSDVEHVLPGECIIIEGSSGFHERRLTWRNTDHSCFSGSFGEAKKEYRRLLLESVDVHLRSDVEIGSCLSGGLDSSAIVGIVREFSKGHNVSQHTFTAVSEDASIDESRYAQAVVDRTKTTSHFITPKSDQLWNSATKLAWHQDEPFGSTSIYAQWKVFEEANKSGIKVMLDGQGADEQLGGYNSFVNTYLVAELRKRHLFRFAKDFLNYKNSSRTSTLGLAQFVAYSTLNERFVKLLGRRFGIASQNHLGWVNEKVVNSCKLGDPFRINGKVPRTVRDLSTDMVFRSNLPMLLRFEDRNSMAHGVEARVPFVDGPLMHFALSLPPEYLLQGDFTKPLLRGSVGDFMPTLVLNRRDKIGFQTAESLWFKKDKLRIEAMVNEAVERLPTLFGATTKQKVMRVLDGYESFNNIPWRVLSTFFWANAHNVQE
jgi:asparagine synthase (glutamine-hydrolysing)